MLPGFVVALAVLVAYVQALGGPLLWDDRSLIQDGTEWEESLPLLEHLKRPLWTGAGAQVASASYYRPLVTLSFALDHRLHGTNAGGYHLTNVLIHVAAALALYALVRKQAVQAWTAAGLAAAWALLPRLAEAGAWISGRADALAGLFAFSALVAFGPSLLRRSLAGCLLGAALLAKESALAAVFALALAEWVSAGPLAVPARARRVLERLLPVVAVVSGYLALRFAFVGYEPGPDAFGAFGRLRMVLEAVGSYAAMLLDPLRPRAVIGRAGAVTLAGTLAGLAVLLGGAVACFRYRARIGPVQALGLGLLIFGLLPVVHAIPIPLRTLAADRFLYIPAAGLVLLLAPAVERAVQVKRAARGALLVIVLLLFAVTVRRVGIWSDETQFWLETYRQTPRTNNIAVLQLGGVFFRAGRLEAALELTERAFEYDDPSQRDPAHNAAVCLSHLGRKQEALRMLLKGAPRRLSADELLLASVMRIHAGEFARARADLENVTGKRQGLARGLLRRLPAMQTAYEELERLGPDGPPLARARLAAVLGDPARATRAWVGVTARPDAPREVLLDGLRHLVSTGERAAIERARNNSVARFGPLEPELAAIVEVRLAELDRLRAAARELGLRASSAAREPG